jgi:hypothetical protein
MRGVLARLRTRSVALMAVALLAGAGAAIVAVGPLESPTSTARAATGGGTATGTTEPATTTTPAGTTTVVNTNTSTLATTVTSPNSSGAVDTSSSMGTLADLVNNLGEQTFPSVFGGSDLTDGGSHLTIYLTTLSPVVEAAFSILPGASGVVQFATAANPLSTLQNLVTQITGQVSNLTATGIQLVSAFPDVRNDGVVDIGVENLTAADTSILDNDFGSSLISVYNVPPADLPVATSSRTYDHDPWHAGDAMTGGSNSQGTFTCSTGVGIDYNGTKYMLTAAHCFDPGWKVYNQQWWNGEGSGTYMGEVHSDDTSARGDDIGLTTITPSGNIWTGPIGHAVSKPIYGWGTNPDGFDVYNEGAASGQLEAQVINNGYGCLFDMEGPPGEAKRAECNLTWAYGINVGYGAANQSGDSGGPVVRYSDNHLLVTGIVNAASTDSKTTCRYNAGSGACYRGLYFTAIDQILNTEYPGATIVKGG